MPEETGEVTAETLLAAAQEYDAAVAAGEQPNVDIKTEEPEPEESPPEEPTETAEAEPEPEGQDVDEPERRRVRVSGPRTRLARTSLGRR